MTRRKLAAALAGVAVALIVTAPPAGAAEPDHTITVAWQMPGPWNPQHPTWPQTYAASAVDVGLDGIDQQLAPCSLYQVDLHPYTTRWQVRQMDALIAGGVLTGPVEKVRPIAVKLVRTEGCESESPTPSPSVSSPSPSPTPSHSTPSPTPSAPTAAPSPSCAHTDNLAEGCLPGTGADLATRDLVALGLGLLVLGAAIIAMIWAFTPGKRNEP